MVFIAFNDHFMWVQKCAMSCTPVHFNPGAGCAVSLRRKLRHGKVQSRGLPANAWYSHILNWVFYDSFILPFLFMSFKKNLCDVMVACEQQRHTISKWLTKPDRSLHASGNTSLSQNAEGAKEVNLGFWELVSPSSDEKSKIWRILQG